jgi:hypothetical protein
MRWGDKGPAPYGTQAPAKSPPGCQKHETRDKLLTRCAEQGPKWDCAGEAHFKRGPRRRNRET